MKKNKKKSITAKQIAFGGVMSGLSLLFLFASAVLPVLEYTSPAFAGAVLGCVLIEINKKTAVSAFVAVSILSIFVVPNKEVAILFIGFFGFYPIVKSLIERIYKTLLRRTVKALVFNVCIILAYQVVIRVVGLEEAFSDFETFGKWSGVILLVAGNIAFVLYDIVLTRGYALYINRLSKRLKIKN